MRFIADFHIHSHYSRATSKEMNIVELTKWSQFKGVNVVGTGDFTHPKWFKEMHETLEQAEPGLFRLKSDYESDIQKEVFESCRVPMRFILSSEISTIYKKNDRVRKVHSIILAPDFKSVATIRNKLEARGANLNSDGRPIIGMDTRDLLEIALEASEDCIFIPAHIWTPHFSVFGSASGFDSLEECFEDMTDRIYAIETGLSSDPNMNWRIKELDGRAIVSNSDAHSARKLGREANIFNTELSYFAIKRALMTDDKEAFPATIEFYPEEGKYHLDGHRNCGVSMEPGETKRCNFLCPKCKRRVTVGVLHRVEELAEPERSKDYKPKNARPFKHIVPLPEVIAGAEGMGAQSKRVQGIYMKLLYNLGSEFSVLINASLGDIENASSSSVAEAVNRMREGKLHIEAGYDGEYGKVKIFNQDDRKRLTEQTAKLF